jgi:enamine deaminase RidA (YjgF/YER057c/UK114 family)
MTKVGKPLAFRCGAAELPGPARFSTHLEGEIMTSSVTTPPLYAKARRVGDLLFVSGQLPINEAGLLYPGQVGADITVEQAQEAAALAAQNCLAVVSDALGSLDAVKGVARLGGYVATAEGFSNAPAVVDAASQQILEALGERGQHARLALGVASLPLGASVEIELAVQC